MMKSFVLVVDFSCWFHIARYMAIKLNATDVHEKTTEVFIQKLRGVKRHLGDMNVRGYDLVFAEDRKPIWKTELLPTYRQGHQDLSKEKNDLKDYLISNGKKSRFCYSDGNEGDDVIASIVYLTKQEQELTTIVSASDRDIWQLIQPRVQVYDPMKHAMTTPEDIHKSLVKWKRLGDVQLEAQHIALLKTLWGDAGDCVPNLLPKTQKHFLPVMVNTNGTLEEFRHVVETESKHYLPAKCYKDFVNAAPELDINYQLVKLREDCELVWE